MVVSTEERAAACWEPLQSVVMAVLHGTRIWMTDGGEFLEDEEAAEFHLLKLVTAAKGRSD